MNFLYFNISICRKSQIHLFMASLTSLDNYKYRIRHKTFDDFVYENIILTELRSSVVPTNNLLLGSYFVKHSKHIFQIISVQKKHIGIFSIFVIRN
uniref:Uncharacterized protein n=1 Tax=Meloidogyne incognita TaxID=6306 RepID=A0A914LMV3_MELIC